MAARPDLDDVSRETMDRLCALEALVLKWNPAINLVSKASLPLIWPRHIEDSAQIYRFLQPEWRVWLDLGSGGGFPGLVVAVLARTARPDLRVHLVESDQRKAVFLRQAIRELDLTALVHAERIEMLPPMAADVVSARALAPLADLCAMTDRHAKHGSTGLFQKGAQHMSEIADARTQWDFDLSSHPSKSDPDGVILAVTNLTRKRKQ